MQMGGRLQCCFLTAVETTYSDRNNLQCHSQLVDSKSHFMPVCETIHPRFLRHTSYHRIVLFAEVRFRHSALEHHGQRTQKAILTSEPRSGDPQVTGSAIGLSFLLESHFKQLILRSRWTTLCLLLVNQAQCSMDIDPSVGNSCKSRISERLLACSCLWQAARNFITSRGAVGYDTDSTPHVHHILMWHLWVSSVKQFSTDGAESCQFICKFDDKSLQCLRGACSYIVRYQAHIP